MATNAPGVLIVDDEPGVRHVLEMLCTRSGLRAITTGCGQEAVELYERHREDIRLVLLDVNMPLIDGPTTLARLRQAGLDAFVCFMSGATGQYTVEQLMALGVERFFEKPFRFEWFCQELTRLACTERLAA